MACILCSQVLYLFNNQLSDVKTFREMPSLQRLYLQNNKLESLEGLDCLPSLTEVNLDGNVLTRIEGLNASTQLSKMSLVSQRTDRAIAFCPELLRRLGDCLKYLDISNNKIEDVTPLKALSSLETLHASGNRVKEFASVSCMLGGCRKLQTLDMRYNPVTRMHRYWDYVVLRASPVLKEIDGHDVTSVQRAFLREFHRRRTPGRARGHGAAGPREALGKQ